VFALLPNGFYCVVAFTLVQLMQDLREPEDYLEAV